MKEDIFWLSECNYSNEIGGKARNLCEMIKLNLPVPEGFVITTDNLTNGIKSEIIKNFKKLVKKYSSVSVRSSANFEDSENGSFAGLFETSLYVDDEKSLFNSIKKCFESVKKQGVKIYAKKHDIDPNKIKMNVIVQGMIDADRSGVIFTKNTINNDNSMIIEIVNGICNNAVAGLITPTRYHVDKKTLKIVEKNIWRNQTLTEKEIKNLIEYGKMLEKYFNKPQDIEWVIQNNKIFLLQTRPITG